MPLNIAVGSPDPVLEKLITEDTAEANQIEERRILISHEPNGLLGSVSSPVNGVRRERVNRSPFSLYYVKLFQCQLMLFFF